MPLYEYRAKGINGVGIRGKVRVDDEKTLISLLRKSNYYLSGLKVCNENSTSIFSLKRGISLKELSLICRQLSLLLSSGIGIIKCLQIIRKNISGNSTKNFIDNACEGIQRGMSISSAFNLERYIPKILISMIKVGETSGKLEDILIRMADYFEREDKIRQKIKQSLTYPAFISIFALIVVNILIFKVIPVFANIFSELKGTELPLPTRMIVSASTFLENNWIFILTVLAILAALLKTGINSIRLKTLLDILKLNVPLYRNIYKNAFILKFAVSYGMLISSGVSAVEGLLICSDISDNIVIKNKILKAIEDIKSGNSISNSFESIEIFPEIIIQLINIGEESGNLDVMLEKSAEIYEAETESQTMKFLSLMEPTVIVLLSVIVGFIVMSVILPIFDMYQLVG